MQSIISYPLSSYQKQKLILKLEAAGLNDDLFRRIIDAEANKLAVKIVEFIQKCDSEHLQMTGFLRDIATGISIPSTEAFLVNECFTDQRVFVYRDPDLDGWLTNAIPAVPAGTATIYQLLKDGLTFRDMAQAVLDRTESINDTEVLARLLIDSGRTFSLKQVEDLITRFERHRNLTCLHSNGEANFFFIHDAANRVWLLRVCRLTDAWSVRLGRLGQTCRWSSVYRLLVRT
jgi:hypothetical protein